MARRFVSPQVHRSKSSWGMGALCHCVGNIRVNSDDKRVCCRLLIAGTPALEPMFHDVYALPPY